MRNLTTALTFAVAAFILTAATLNSRASEGRFCSPVASVGEGHWPIDEAEFTKERARKALDSLSKYIDQVDTRMDFVSIDNDLLQVKGYLLRAHAMESELRV